MFSYFERLDEEKKDGIGYRKRVSKRCEEIMADAFKTDKNFEEALNLETLAVMSVPIEKLKIPSIYSISKFADDYEKYIKERFFHGMSVKEFENDDELMLKFNLTKEVLRKEYTDMRYDGLCEDYAEFESFPKREKIVKPIHNPGIYASFYDSPDNMWEYLYCKRTSNRFADLILNNGIDDFINKTSYLLNCYSDTDDQESIRNAIRGVSKELKRRNKKLSDEENDKIKNMLKSI